MKTHAKWRLAMFSLILLMIAAFSAQAQQASLGEEDKEFMKEAAIGGMAEVKLGKLAAQRAQNEQVRQFGERMVTDHSKANERLRQLAQEKRYSLPSELDKEKQEDVDRLSKLEGQEFDREYMSYMVEDHKEDVEKFSKQAEQGGDAEIKEFAAQTLNVLKEHLALAQDINQKVK
jgi:putative membrane protein